MHGQKGILCDTLQLLEQNFTLFMRGGYKDRGQIQRDEEINGIRFLAVKFTESIKSFKKIKKNVFVK